MSDLPEFDVTARLARLVDGVREYHAWTARIPAVDQEHADQAAGDLALLINEASGFAWRLTEESQAPAVPVGADVGPAPSAPSAAP